MKFVIAIFLMLCLQVAMSPLCLCLRAALDEDSPVRACCQAPADEEPAPCPHCDQEMPMAATPPQKSDFSADPPEWHGFECLVGVELFDKLLLRSQDFSVKFEVEDFDPPPLPFRKVYGVFLI